MLKKVTTISLFLVASITGNPMAADIFISPENTSIDIKLESTWHWVYGKAHEFSGTLSVDNPAHPSVVSGTVTVKASSLDTGSEKRDRKMKSYSLDVTKFPEIIFEIDAFVNNTVTGMLSIRGVKKRVALQVQREVAERNGKRGLLYRGEAIIKWKEFGVPDPSIFIARVYDDLSISVGVFVVWK